MAANNIGGFFLELGVNPNMAAFDAASKLVDGLTGKYNKLIGTMRNAAAESTLVASSEQRLSEAFGLTIKDLDAWKIAAEIAGVNANGLVSSIGQLANVMQHVKIDASGLEAYQEQLSKLKIGFEEIKDMDASDAFAYILNVAQTRLNKEGWDKNTVMAAVRDIVGAEGAGIFTDMITQNKTIYQLLNEAQSINLSTEADKKAAADAQREFNILEEELKSVGQLFGQEIATALAGPVSKINNWFDKHGEEIATTIRLIGDVTQGIIDLIGPLISEILRIFGGEAKGLLSGVNDIQNGNFKEGVNKLMESGEGAFKIIQGLKNPGDLLLYGLQFAMSYLPDDVKQKKLPWVKDGIMRPDGTITQVAPDDWVFAARNVGDLAQAFIPQGMGSAGGINTFTINQTFNIGATKDMPQILRQQAYNGARDGLMQTMAQSSQRLQMMSGTR